MSISDRILDQANEFANILKSRYGARGVSLGKLTSSVEDKLPIGTVLMLRRWTTIRNKVIKEREGFPVKIYRDEVDVKHYNKLTSEIMAAFVETGMPPSSLHANPTPRSVPKASPQLASVLASVALKYWKSLSAADKEKYDMVFVKCNCGNHSRIPKYIKVKVRCKNCRRVEEHQVY